MIHFFNWWVKNKSKQTNQLYLGTERNGAQKTIVNNRIPRL